jgi:hypothetical protein
VNFGFTRESSRAGRPGGPPGEGRGAQPHETAGTEDRGTEDRGTEDRGTEDRGDQAGAAPPATSRVARQAKHDRPYLLVGWIRQPL